MEARDISVVVQGAVDRRLTAVCLGSFRRLLPGAQLILSTWEGTDPSGLDCDILVRSPDPGASAMDTARASSYNLNRMLRSSQAGLERAERPYVLKCRSDTELVGTGFLRAFDSFPARDERLSLARHKMVIPCLYTMRYEREWGKTHPTPYHISDWYCFGLREDVCCLFSAPLVEMEDFARYFEHHPRPRDYAIGWLGHRLWRFPPEQYLGVTYARRLFPDLDFPDCLSYDRVDPVRAERFLLSNFIVLEPLDFGLIVRKAYYEEISCDLSRCPRHVWPGIYRRAVYERACRRQFGYGPVHPDTLLWRHVLRRTQALGRKVVGLSGQGT